MNRFSIAQDVTKQLSNMQLVVVVAYNLNNEAENPLVAEFAQTTATTTLTTLSTYPSAQSHPRIPLYRTTLKATCNIPPKKYPQSNESLYKRLLKSCSPLTPINSVVDFYNAVSVKHAVTAGAFDLGELQTRSQEGLELRFSTEGDAFRALGKDEGDEGEKVGEGELVYGQGGTVLTRQLAWRQTREGLLGRGTRDVVFVSEVFGEGEKEVEELARAVAGEFVDGLKRFFGVEARVTVLGVGVGVWDVEVENGFF